MEYQFRSKVLDSLGVRSWINARNWTSTIGGCWIDDRVLEAMNDVAKTFVDMFELFAKADEMVAKLCHVEDAHITSGAAAAVELSVAACVAENSPERWSRLPNTEGMRNEVVFPRSHYTAYAPQWKATGAKLVEYGQAGILKSYKREIESLINEKTCCLSYTVSYNTSANGLIPLEEVIEVGKRNKIPVVIDCAGMLPPVSNLHKFTDMGVDIACFSGGKAIKAPSGTGIILGNGKGAEIIENLRNYSYPNDGWGRGHKISKEEVVGLLAALEIFVKEGDDQYDKQMKTAEYLVNEFADIPNVNAVVIPNDENFHEHPVVPHVPRVLVEWDPKKIKLSAKDMDKAMAMEDPPVYLKERHYSNYTTNKAWRIIDTYFLRSDEEKIIAERMKRILEENQA